jgi:hypothetical protein
MTAKVYVPTKHQDLFKRCNHILKTFIPNYDTTTTTPEQIANLQLGVSSDVSNFITTLMLLYCIEGQLTREMCNTDFNYTTQFIIKIENELEVFKSLFFGDKHRLVENVTTQVYS